VGGAARQNSSPPGLTGKQGRLVSAALLYTAFLVGTAPLILVILLTGQQHSVSGWLYGLAGIGIGSVTVLTLLWFQRAPDAAPGTALTFGRYRSRLRPKALQATLTTQAAIDRIGQSLADRLVAGNLQNYSGILSVELTAATRSLAPTAEGGFRVGGAFPLTINVTLSPKPVADAVAEPVTISGGVDVPVVDFVLIVSIEDQDALPRFTQRSPVSVGVTGPAAGVTFAATALAEQGDYQLIVEALQQNRLVHVLRAPVRVIAATDD
jgi:hypothetical protein